MVHGLTEADIGARWLGACPGAAHISIRLCYNPLSLLSAGPRESFEYFMGHYGPIFTLFESLI